MDNDKENTFSSASPSRNRRRRSSILKDSPGRKVLENTAVSQQRRSSKRVSFADTKTIKEFLATKGNLTEWNSTYETSASCDTSNSMDMTCCPDKSIMLDKGDGLDNYDGSPALETNFEKIEDIEDPTSLDTTCDSPNFLREFLSLGPSKSSKSSEENPQESEDDAISATTNFLNSFISIKPSVAPESPVCAPAARVRTDSEEGLDIYSDQTEQLMQDDIARMMTADFANTWLSQSNAKAPLKSTADPFLHVTKDPVNQPLDNKMVATSSSQLAKYSLANATPVLPAEIGMIIASNQIEKVHRNEPTQKLGTDKEITCPSDYVSKIMKGDHAQKFIEDMVMTCATDNISKLMQNDQTQKLSADMEITCAMGNIAKLMKNDETQKLFADMEMTCAMGNIAKLKQNDQTQKLSADMEMTCATGNIAKLMQNDQTQKLSADMEMTCAMGNIAKLMQNDQTQKLSTDMEMTCATGNIAKLVQNDQRQKLYADMEITCATGNIAKLMQKDQTEKISADMEMTCATGNIAKLIQNDQTQKLSADMEMTCATGNIAKLMQNDQTKKFSADMEMTCAMGNIAELKQNDQTQKLSADMEMTCATGNIAKLMQNDQTQKLSADMEMTCVMGNIAKLKQNDQTQKLSADMEMTCAMGNITKLKQNDQTQKLSADMEMTCATGNIAKLVQNDQRQKLSADMEMTCAMGNIAKLKQNDQTQKLYADMEMTCAGDNIAKLTKNGQTQKLSTDLEITCATGNIAKLMKNDQTQKLSADMEITSAMGNIAKLQNDQTHKLSADMEMTCATGNIAKLMKNDQTQKLSADMEITCAMGNIANMQNDQTHKLSADMEMTCATGNIAKLMKNDQNQKLYADMAMTCATGNVAKPMQNDQTQKLTVDMEMTHAMGNVAGLLHQLHSSEVCSNAAVSDTETGSAEKLSADKVTACHSSDTKQRPGSNLKEASNPNINQLNRCGITRMFSALDLQQNPQEKQMSALLDTVADSTNLGQIAELGRTKAGTIASHSFSQASKLPGNEVSNRKSVGLNVTCPANEPTEAVADNRQERKSMYARVTYSMNHEGENRAMEYAGVRISDCENQNVEEICAEEPHLGNALPLKTGQNSSHRRMSSMGFVSFTDKTSDLSQQILQSFSSDSVACSNKSKIVDVQGKISDIDKEERLLSPTFLQNQKIDKDSEGTFKSERLPSPNAQIKRKHDGKEDSDSTLKIHAGEDRSLYRAFQSDANIPTANSVCNSTSVNDQGEVFPNSEQADQLISAFINNEVSPAKTNSTPSVSCDGNSKTLLIKNSKIEDSLSEECLEDIYMDMDNSANISLEYSSGENVCVSPVADASVNKSLLELVVNDALSSLPTEVETFKKRFSEIQEGHADFEKTLEEGTHKHNVRKKIIASATMSVLQLSQSIQNMSAEVLENTCTQETNLSKSESTKETEECFQSILHDADSGNAEASQLAPPPQHISGTNGSMETQHNVNLELKGTQETGEYTPAEVTSAVSSNLQDSQKIYQIGLQAEEIQRSNQSFNSTISSFGVIVESSMKQKFCTPCESVDLQGEFFFDSSNFTSRWMLKEVSKGVRVLTLQHTPLEIMLNVTHTDDHWTVTTATWKPQAKDLKNDDSRLVMKTLGCRIAAAMLELYGLALCEVGEALDKVAAAFEDVSTLLLEFQVIKTAYLTEFDVNSVNITLFNSHRHICVTVLIQITPPAPSPENPCTLQASAKVTVGNITNKTVEEAMAGVIPGPKKILRMVRAADLVVQGKM